MGEYIIGIDVGGTNIKMMAVDSKFKFVSSASMETCSESGYEAVSDKIIQRLDEMLSGTGSAGRKVLSIGMGLPGTVDIKAQRTVYLAKLMWNGFNPCRKIADHYRAPCFIDNDASMGVLGEYYFGNPERSRNIVMLTLGTGVGGGVVLNDEVFRGAENLGAEFGHMIIVSDDGEECLCGRKGHFEAYCSGTALKRYALGRMSAEKQTVLHEYLAENGGVFDNAMVTKGFRANDRLSREIWERYIHYLSIGISNIMMLFNPDKVLLGGGISNAGKELLCDPVYEQAGRLVIDKRQHCPVEISMLGSKAGMYGACAHAARGIGLRLHPIE
ncbi:MAG: ROK family protein [Christensenellaceae bacterium]|nr:ROK family protein [Christensenellaceae bacterium]